MTKVDQLEARPAACVPISPRRSPADPRPRDDNSKTRQLRDSANEIDDRQHQRRRGRPHDSSSRTKIRSNAGAKTAAPPNDRVPTTEQAPETKPVEGPVPPPWSGSTFRGASCTDNDDRHSDSGGGSGSGNGSSADEVELRFVSSSGLHEAWGSKTMTIFAQEEGGQYRTKVGGDGGGGDVKSVLGDGEGEGDGDDGSGGCSSSFLSFGLEDSSWVTFPGDIGEERLSCENNEEILAEMEVETPAKRGPARPSARGRARVVKLEAAAAAGGVNRCGGIGEGVSRVSANPDSPKYPRQQRSSTIDIALAEPHHIDQLELDIPKPCPEMYDIWIPQHSFHGKAFTPSRERDQQNTADAATFATSLAGASVDQKDETANCSVVRTSSDLRSSPRAVSALTQPDKSCANGSRTFGNAPIAEENQMTSTCHAIPPALKRRQSYGPVPIVPVIPAVIRVAEEVLRNDPRALPHGTTFARDRIVELVIPNRSTKSAPPEPLLDVDSALVNGDGCQGEGRHGEGPDTGRGGGDSEVGGSAGGYFDYTKGISWRTTAEMAEQDSEAQVEVEEEELGIEVCESTQGVSRELVVTYVQNLQNGRMSHNKKHDLVCRADPSFNLRYTIRITCTFTECTENKAGLFHNL